jgi:adenosyl cobinamide kinase/adenosyl cobinamide phosphate guanylyltransferase
MFPAFFLEAAASVSPEQPPESGVGSSPKDAGEAAQERPTILIDCVTLWVSNILFALPEPEDLTAFETAVRTEVNALLALMERSNCRWILVSGETGLGGIASDRISRNYCDGLGLANQLIAASARKVFLVVAGCSLVLAE